MKRHARLILFAVLILAAALPGVRAVAQMEDSATLQNGAEWVEEASGRAYLCAALLLTWVGIVVFLAALFRGQQRIGRRLDRIEREKSDGR